MRFAWFWAESKANGVIHYILTNLSTDHYITHKREIHQKYARAVPQVLLTGSKLATPTTAPTITTNTMPPAPMLSKKFLREGVIPDPAASATSGTIMDTVNAAAVNPVTAFSLSEALTTNFPVVFDATTALEGLTDNGLKAALQVRNLFWVAEVNGVDAITAEVQAILFFSFFTREDAFVGILGCAQCEEVDMGGDLDTEGRRVR